ncbi:MAG: hypothetical protein GTN43_02075, partial [Candidatus Aenigmarchaeota archaeon]|nr:hypothetical protein [Candidatus Aenigmarchaeota archaeon]
LPKPSIGVRGAEFRDPSTILERIAQSDFPFIIQPKSDGIRIIVHKDGDKVEMFTESGLPINPKIIPTVWSQIQDIKEPGSFIVDAEGIMMESGKRVGHSIVAGYLNSGKFDKDRDNSFQLIAHDLVLQNGVDLHSGALINSVRKLDDIQETKNFRIAPWKLAKNESALVDAIQNFRIISEGAVIKQASKPYPIRGGATDWWLKFRNQGYLLVKVFNKSKEAVQGEGWRYMVSIKDEKGQDI